MGVLIQGPWKARPQTTEESSEVSETVSEAPIVVLSSGAEVVTSGIAYPWHTLAGPKGTKPAEHAKMLARLQKLAKVVNASGGTLLLPTGWFWDPNKNQKLIEELSRIGRMTSEEIPDDIA